MNMEYKRIAVIDIDGTLLKGQIQQELLKFLYKKGKLRFAYFLRLNLWFLLYKFHLVSNPRSIYEYGIIFLKNKSVEEIDRLITDFLEDQFTLLVYSKSSDFIASLKHDEKAVILLSTAIDPIVKKIAALFNIETYICTHPDVIGGHYTGKISGEIVHGEAKMLILNRFAQERGYRMSDMEAYADHVSDIPMLRSVGKGYIVNPSRALKSLALKLQLGIMFTQ